MLLLLLLLFFKVTKLSNNPACNCTFRNRNLPHSTLFLYFFTSKVYLSVTDLVVTWKLISSREFSATAISSHNCHLLQENTCARDSFLITLQAFATLLKKSLWHRCFPVNFEKFLRTSFLQSTSERMLLHVEKEQTQSDFQGNTKQWFMGKSFVF